uniref:Uncharacterized protein n=1 Tax=Haemonchus contortus TaxID=6289 RepID=A0A7I4XX98_HAECO
YSSPSQQIKASVFHSFPLDNSSAEYGMRPHSTSIQNRRSYGKRTCPIQ